MITGPETCRKRKLSSRQLRCLFNNIQGCMQGKDGWMVITCHLLFLSQKPPRSQSSRFSVTVCAVTQAESVSCELHAVLGLVSGAKRGAVKAHAGFSSSATWSLVYFLLCAQGSSREGELS